MLSPCYRVSLRGSSAANMKERWSGETGMWLGLGSVVVHTVCTVHWEHTFPYKIPADQKV